LFFFFIFLPVEVDMDELLFEDICIELMFLSIAVASIPSKMEDRSSDDVDGTSRLDLSLLARLLAGLLLVEGISSGSGTGDDDGLLAEVGRSVGTAVVSSASKS